MVKTKGLARTVGKWIARAAVASDDFKAGIENPKTPWESSTLAAVGTFKSAIASPDVPKLFSAGVKKAGDAKWSKMALEKGVGRFSDGIEKSKEYFEGSMGPVLSTIEATTLSKRGPRGSAINYNRSKEIGTALHAKRLAARAVA